MRSVTALLLFFVLSACAAPVAPAAGARSEVSLSFSTLDAAAVLALVNYPGTDLEVLDVTIGLDRRAAENIMGHRCGVDARCPSADDDLFDDVAELDGISYVGDSAFDKLLTYASDHPVPADESVEGVLFRGWEAEAVVWGVANTALAELDGAVGLDARAARNLVDGVPYPTVTEMGAVGYVGGSALGLLRAYAPLWWERIRGGVGPDPSVTVDGVTFDLRTSHVALEIANLATEHELVAHGMWSTGAARMVAGRPYVDLVAVGAVSGVGNATMGALHDYATSGEWVFPGDCSVGLRSRTDADVADLDRLLSLATTLDWPYAEVVAFQPNACFSMGDAGARDALFEEMVLSPGIDWGYGGGVYPEGEDFFRGASRFVRMMDYARMAILESVADGRWTPSDDEERELLGRLDALHEALTSAPRAEPSRFYETVLRIEASECSQDAAILVDPADNRIWVVHILPRC